MHEHLIYETHSHTPLCKHAKGEPEDYAEVAHRRGLRGIIFTCHNPMPNGFSAAVRMAEDELPRYVEMVERARQTWEDRVDVRLGLEADYFSGYEGWLEKQLDSADFHYVLGSVHPQIGEFREQYWHGDPVEFHTVYFEKLVEAAETGLFDCLSHPDIVKIVKPKDWRPDVLMNTVRRALDRIAATGIAMELNTSGANKVVPEMNPFPEMLAEMRKRDIPVVVGADAHVPSRVGDRFLDAYALLESVGYDAVCFFLERKPRSISIEVARQSLLKYDAVNPEG